MLVGVYLLVRELSLNWAVGRFVIHGLTKCGMLLLDLGQRNFNNLPSELLSQRQFGSNGFRIRKY